MHTRVIQLTVNHTLALENSLLNTLTCMVDLQLDQTILNNSWTLGASLQQMLPSISGCPWIVAASKFKTRLIVAATFNQVNTVHYMLHCLLSVLGSCVGYAVIKSANFFLCSFCLFKYCEYRILLGICNIVYQKLKTDAKRSHSL